MNLAWPRILKSAYRKEPVTSFIVTMGAVDSVIGGVGARGSLLTLGLTMVGIAVVLRWWQLQRSALEQPERVPEHYLPPSSSQPLLPPLKTKKYPRH